ncbi:MAG: ribosome assembly RNA-binding protein YhbY [Piscirickettsiaceae bacterium CG_4_9_14_3_um_filter_43_564]|nr:ribosome assembly RNA-binding protein YhbY [Thiomicrospira sp.]OIP94206.1 MAG: RNA-binding protein [Thiomicrospira sp. CG2_30_44_34]PIQ05422.1 MAG: ribosome assembly RNA-binding protein YhbY [Piscirickettsiaceae bacterium CG18_big_fil_WC_8_21_14_2_50_44_103]PIU38270.1 MAG: ribosome assembly RNA-binding protein YhbY [Piscirickettsiaceae bacterium CG07_land_8_20_14_0_80_44_28]PIW57611.1 MAG: ribosome assembly RNA-binding protein YhbY [Piscirickettsiaceae bacterium CG12_big_fil_rev_8_21_14_0_65
MSNDTPLSNTQKRFLKGIAHGLNPVILIGGNGLTEGLMKELEKSLAHHELLKIKIASAEREDRKAIVETLLKATQAQLVQSIGKVVVIYRQAKAPLLQLPK